MKKTLTLAALTLTLGCSGANPEAMKTDAMDKVEKAEGDAHTMAAQVADAVTVAPDNYSVLMEDDHIRILEMKLPAGAKDGLHSHPDEAVYFVKGGTAKVHLPDGTSMEMEAPDGMVMSHEAWTHTVENIGETDLHAIVFEVKDGAREKVTAVAADKDAVAVAPDNYKVLAEDERCRILEMTLPAGTKDGVHAHPIEAVYFVTGGKVKVHLPDGNVAEMEVPDGGTMVHEAWEHTVENVGDTDIKAIVVELKNG